MIKDFSGKVAVITGGGNGIGRATAKALLDKGASVVIADMDQDALDATADLFAAGERLHTVCVDVSTLEANEQVAREALECFGAVHVVHLNAATMGDAGGWRASDISVEGWRTTLAASLDGPFYGVKAFLPLLEQQAEAHIVFTASSFAWLTALSDPAPYFVAKAGLLSYAECLYHDLRDRGSHIGVSAVLPGNTQTGPYEMIKEFLVASEQDPGLWDPEVWGDRRYAADLVELFTNEGTLPDVVAAGIVGALVDDTFYVTPNIGAEIWKHIDARWERFRQGRNPALLDKGLTVYRPLQEGE